MKCLKWRRRIGSISTSQSESHRQGFWRVLVRCQDLRFRYGTITIPRCIVFLLYPVVSNSSGSQTLQNSEKRLVTCCFKMCRRTTIEKTKLVRPTSGFAVHHFDDVNPSVPIFKCWFKEVYTGFLGLRFMKSTES